MRRWRCTSRGCGDVLWSGDDEHCWACSEPGVIASWGDEPMAGSHMRRSATRQVTVAGHLVDIDPDEEEMTA